MFICVFQWFIVVLFDIHRHQSTFAGSYHIYVTLDFTVYLIISDGLFNLSKLAVTLSKLGEGGNLDHKRLLGSVQKEKTFLSVIQSQFY